MADKNSDEATSSENGDSKIMINVKTLDSRVFPFQASKNMTVFTLKEKIADVIGAPVLQQRLIFRGKVLKDDQPLSSYSVEDGDTFHLVSRQPAQNENQQGTNSAAASANSENPGIGTTGGAPWNRPGVVGQISHNIVLGPITLGVGEENPQSIDFNRIIRSFVNSVGLATPTENAADTGVGGENPSAIDLNQILRSVVNSLGLAAPTENAASTGNPTSTNPANVTVSSSATSNPSGNHVPASTNLFPFPVFNQNQATPNSLITLSTFIRHLEQALGSHGYQSQAPGTGSSPGLSTLSSNSTLLRPESLGIVMSQAQNLLNGQVAAALSHITDLLGRQASLADPVLRNEVQSQSTYVGVTLQHLGAMLLELGRTTLALRMGESPAEGFVAAGPAVYISATGPTPIMVQPALHTAPLFGFSRSVPLSVSTVRVQSAGTAVGSSERDGTDNRSAETQPTTETRSAESNQTAQPENIGENTSGQSESKTEASAPLPAEESSGTAAEGKKEKKNAPLGLGLGGLQPKRKSKLSESQSKSKSIAMGQQVLQTLAETAGGSGGPSSSQGSGSSQGVDFSKLFSQMIPVVSQALGVSGPAEGSRSGNAPHRTDEGEEGITQAEIRRVIERLVNGDSRGSVFRAMVETASRVYKESGGNHSEDIDEALGEDGDLSDAFFEMLRRGGAGSRGS